MCPIHPPHGRPIAPPGFAEAERRAAATKKWLKTTPWAADPRLQHWSLFMAPSREGWHTYMSDERRAPNDRFVAKLAGLGLTGGAEDLTLRMLAAGAHPNLAEGTVHEILRQLRQGPPDVAGSPALTVR